MDVSLVGDMLHTIFGSLTLTYDLVSRIIVSGADLLYYLRWDLQILCVDSSWDGRVVVHSILCHFDLEIDF